MDSFLQKSLMVIRDILSYFYLERKMLLMQANKNYKNNKNYHMSHFLIGRLNENLVLLHVF